MSILLIILFLLLALYLLGFLPVSVKRSTTFVGSGFGRASFTNCHGSIHRIVRFPESRSYSFQLSGRVQKGSVTAQLLDKNRQPVLTLDKDTPSGVVTVQKRKRYYLYIRFENASGDYALEWD